MDGRKTQHSADFLIAGKLLIEKNNIFRLTYLVMNDETEVCLAEVGDNLFLSFSYFYASLRLNKLLRSSRAGREKNLILRS